MAANFKSKDQSKRRLQKFRLYCEPFYHPEPNDLADSMIFSVFGD